MLQRTAFALTLAWASLIAAFGVQADQPFPERPIRMLVGFSAGGPTDQAARIVAEGMRNTLGQQVIVENRPGANSVIAVKALQSAKPDGYTVLLASNGILTVAGARYKSLPFDVRNDFVPVGSVAGYSEVLVMPAANAAPDLKTLIANARASAPTIATVGNVDELTLALLRKLTGVKAQSIPYKGQSDVLNDVLSGRVDMAFLSPTAARPLIQDGRLRAIAVTGKHRAIGLPDVPTMHEGGIAGFEVDIWNALVAPPGTSPAIVAALSKSLRAALADRSVQAKLDASGLLPMPDTPDALAAKIDSEGRKWKTLAQEEKLPQLDF